MDYSKLTLLGMSGVGKTHLATILGKTQKCYHYSGDYRIGSKYLSSDILSNIKDYMHNDIYLHKLLINNSITVKHHISFDNLSVVSDFLGKVGNPKLGGMAINEFKRRQNLHLNAEKQAMLDVLEFIQKAKNIGINNFINDAGGSLCEIDDPAVYQTLADNTLIVYIKANANTTKELVKRSVSSPKPLYYNPEFLDKYLNIYLNNNNLVYAAQINPDDFMSFVFPYLINYRLPKYAKIADKYGVTIDADDMYQCKNSDDFFDLLKQCR